VLEKMDRTLKDRIEEEKKTGKPFPEYKIWIYFI